VGNYEEKNGYNGIGVNALNKGGTSKFFHIEYGGTEKRQIDPE
jgi:hypothetical protein